MSTSPDLEQTFKKSCTDFTRDVLELSKQMEKTQEEVQKQKEKNDGHITELEGIQERLKNMRKTFQETAAEHSDCCGLVGSGSGDGEGEKDGVSNEDKDGR